MADYIPGGDAAFNAWLDNFVTYATANLANLGLVAGDLTPVTTAQTAWATSLSAHVTAQQAAKSATQGPLRGPFWASTMNWAVRIAEPCSSAAAIMHIRRS